MSEQTLPESKPVRVLIVTDVPEAATLTRSMLEAAAEVEVLDTAVSGDEALTLARVHQPDVVVMDYDMPGLDGATATRTILHEDDSIQVIMLSVVNDAEDIRHAMRAGARDYLVKPLADGELIGTIRWLINERREYARMQGFVTDLRRAYDALFTDDKPVPENVIAFLEAQAAEPNAERVTLETLAVAYARNRDWTKLAPIVRQLVGTQTIT